MRKRWRSSRAEENHLGTAASAVQPSAARRLGAVVWGFPFRPSMTDFWFFAASFLRSPAILDFGGASLSPDSRGGCRYVTLRVPWNFTGVIFRTCNAMTNRISSLFVPTGAGFFPATHARLP